MPPAPPAALTSIRGLALLLAGLAVALTTAHPAGATSLAYQGSDGTAVQQYLEILPDGVTQTLPSGNTFVITRTDAGQYHACRSFVVMRQGGVGASPSRAATWFSRCGSSPTGGTRSRPSFADDPR